MKKRCMVVFIAFVGLVGVGRVNAQYLSGSITADDPLTGPLGVATASSMMLTQTNIVQSATGNFSGTVPINSKAYSFTGAIGGLSTTPKTVSDNLLDFPGLPYRFSFTLDTITEESYDSSTGQAVFTGTGTIADNTGQYQTTPADLTVDFTSPGAYSFTLETVPEPTTACLAGLGLFGLWAWRPRRR